MLSLQTVMVICVCVSILCCFAGVAMLVYNEYTRNSVALNIGTVVTALGIMVAGISGTIWLQVR